MSFQLLGPISSQTSFMIVLPINNDPHALMLGPTGPTGPVRYSLISLSDSKGPTGSFGVFTAKGTDSSMTISDTANGGWLAFDSENFVANTSSSYTVSIIQDSSPQYQPWQAPTVFLGGVDYSMKTKSGATGLVQFVEKPAKTGDTGPFVFQILPVTWYTNCSNGTYISPQNVFESLLDWACSYNSGLTGCEIVPPGITDGWTTLADCNAGVVYNYCPQGDYCGNGNCNGPCSASYDNCEIPDGSNYKCVIDPKKYFTDTKWWESKWFIGVISTIAAIILILIVVVFAIIKHKLDSDDDDNTN